MVVSLALSFFNCKYYRPQCREDNTADRKGSLLKRYPFYDRTKAHRSRPSQRVRHLVLYNRDAGMLFKETHSIPTQ